MANVNDALAAAYGPFTPTSVKTSTESTVNTSWTQVVDAKGVDSAVYRLVSIDNTSAAAKLYVGFSALDGANPTYAGIIIQAGQNKTFTVRGDTEVHIKASASGTGYGLLVKED